MTRDHRINIAVLALAITLMLYLTATPQQDFAPMASWWFYDVFMITLSTMFWLLLCGSSLVLSVTLLWLLKRTGPAAGRWLPLAFAGFFATLSLLAVVHAIIIWIPLYWLAIGVQGLAGIAGTATAIATRMRRHELANIVQYLVFRTNGGA